MHYRLARSMGGGWTACARVRVVRCVSGLCKAWRSRRAQTRPRPQSSCCPLPAQPALRDASASVCERTVQSGESTGGSADAGAQRAGAGGHRARRGTRERRVGSRCGRPCSSEATDWAALAPALWATPPRPARPWSSSWARPSSRQEPCAWAPFSVHFTVAASHFALSAEGATLTERRDVVRGLASLRGGLEASSVVAAEALVREPQAHAARRGTGGASRAGSAPGRSPDELTG